MRVAISSIGRFWVFDLAEQMRQRGLLTRLYTGYPSFKVDQPLRSLTHTCPWRLSFLLLAQRIGMSGVASRLNWPTLESFDRWVAKQAEPCDVFVFLSSCGLHSSRRSKALGARVVCDRGSGWEASVNSLNTPVTRKWVCSPTSTAWSPNRSR